MHCLPASLQKYFTIFNASALKLGAGLIRAIHPNAYAYDEKLVSNREMHE